MFARLIAATGVVAASLAVGLSLSPTPVSAAPAGARTGVVTAPKAAPKPDSVLIAGKFPDGKLTIKQAEHSELFQRLLAEVNWLGSATPTTSKPAADKLGPKFTLTVQIKDKANQVYDLYPLASGGPRAYRPAQQPTGKKAAGWFYGRLTMSESLRLSGVPLEAKPDVVSGGIGAGSGVNVKDEELDPLAVSKDVFAQLQRLFLLNGAVLLVVLLGLAGVAFLIRRRV
ncbi:hypothetical protein [Actinoplanes sp. TFC3]|uniref:hypothetical protein n=1 Tax=Actinoplanes sp. TFC3 TaxID=1710355 RepID=UPI00083266B1|nr:hypothetical protein [Actinoplanes sp. TFC3]